MQLLRWDFALLAERLCAVLATAEAELEVEQAVKGLDLLHEQKLQSLLAQGLAQHHQVRREVHYPSTAGRKLSHRQRCDLVLTPQGCSPESATEEALWLEVKVAPQFMEGGHRHPGYTGRWHAVVRDLAKMSAEPSMHHAALALVVFTESESLLNKDLDALETLMLRRRVVAGFRHVRTFPVRDRIGHRICSVALWPTPVRG